jgi:hypothetical protein
LLPVIALALTPVGKISLGLLVTLLRSLWYG